MKHLDFPVSAAAVHRHGREFHEQDFFDVAPAPPHQLIQETQGAEPTEAALSQAVRAHRSLAGERLRTLAHWTIVCIVVGLAVMVLMSWLVHPDLRHVTWIDSTAQQAGTASR